MPIATLISQLSRPCVTLFCTPASGSRFRTTNTTTQIDKLQKDNARYEAGASASEAKAAEVVALQDRLDAAESDRDDLEKQVSGTVLATAGA